VTFDELAEDFLRDYRINKRKSLDRAETSVGHLKKEFEGVRVLDITTPRIQVYVENRMQQTCNDCKGEFDAQDKCLFVDQKI
jgi:hypothetical protein